MPSITNRGSPKPPLILMVDVAPIMPELPTIVAPDARPAREFDKFAFGISFNSSDYTFEIAPVMFTFFCTP